MRIELGRFGVWRRLGDISEDQARKAEALGFGAIWVGASPPADLTEIERLIAATERIPVVTGVVNMWRADPDAVAASYHRIERGHPHRFLLGVGVGHPESTKEFSRPLDKINQYLDHLHKAGVPADRLVLAALGPKVLSVAANRTAGAHPYLTSPRHTSLARKVLGDGPLLAPTPTVVFTTDVSAARATARAFVARYLGLSNYRQNLLREGWDEADLDHGGSDRLIDALFLHGTAEQIAEGLRAH
ncbi:MAG: TIGR03620 family F420-dependent LLM class oxidoreductase, partial [Actinobacteria bacterium]|nr:TIGR03620 family F420-dependent LLM class oxidoreductase [Actinomycetota bacterium]